MTNIPVTTPKIGAKIALDKRRIVTWFKLTAAVDLIDDLNQLSSFQRWVIVPEVFPVSPKICFKYLLALIESK